MYAITFELGITYNDGLIWKLIKWLFLLYYIEDKKGERTVDNC
jgi:hypothetical protein